ncbi:MAG TPA: FtsW/RodA/SpoVE family cell cycle protein [Vicinamibacterales bacterium]|nr:FtsW/RodA/SpoVE family cell cycle protein [Vicinamibacterales bacterium]
MAVVTATTTRTTAAERSRRSMMTRPSIAIWPPSTADIALGVATLVTAVALVLTYYAKRDAMHDSIAGVERAEVVDLSRVTGPDAIETALAAVLPDRADRRFTAASIYRFLTDEGRRAPEAANVGALAGIRVTPSEVQRAGSSRLLARERTVPGAGDVRLLTASEIAELKRSFIVRGPSAFRSTLGWSVLLYVASFYLVAFYWRLRRFRGDPWLLPLAHVMTGLGLVAMLALQDPLRDRLLVAEFAVGVSAGCLGLAVLSSFAYQASGLRRLSLLPLLAAAAASILLILFGSGPGTSDAKVNLFGMQPVEGIRILLVLYLAGYFASRWEFVRQLREEQFGGLELPKRFRIPRYDHVLPVIVGVGLALLLFFLQKDLGPALVFICLFLSLYGVARKAVALVVLGVLLMLGGFVAGYTLGYPGTIVTRVAMWLSPWDNAMRGGDHVAQALWAFASGGATGTGLALGEPNAIPEAHTDMVLATLGEELGFAGVLVIALLYAALFYRGFAIAMRAGGDYAFFLALGLTLSLAFPVLLIAAGTLGLFPLSGVATPYLSYGKSSMIANLAVLGMLFGISRENARSQTLTEPFRTAVRVVGIVVAVLAAAILMRAAAVQVVYADATLAATSLAPQADGVLRFQDNPRLRRASLLIPRGAVLDRRGVPLAVTDCADLQKHAHALGQLGAAPACDRRAPRHYPLSGHTYHLLGDVRTRVNWAATNTSFEERDHGARLRGFAGGEQVVERIDPRSGEPVRAIRRDFAELVPLWRYRHRPGHPEVQALMERSRDLRVTIDARLQTRLGQALDRQLQSIGRSRGAIVVMDAESGDVLALVNAPRPAVSDADALRTESRPPPGDPAWFDRARYGVYPPGSTFKLVTAAAALRKDPSLGEVTFMCRRLPDGRIGHRVPGWTRPVRDDELNTVPHGAVNLKSGIEKSCNAYFAQLGLRVGAAALHDAATLFEIALAQPDTVQRLRDQLPQAAYGQGEVRVTPFKMARVAAAIANGGRMPYGRWVSDAGDRRDRDPVTVMTPAIAAEIGSHMRGAVLRGTARALATVTPALAGKTGTAEVEGAPSHAWFAGFAPYGPARGRRIAFAVLLENGGYGGRTAAPLAAEIVRAARELGLLE